MPTREIDETEFVRSEALRKTVGAMLANKDARKLLLQAQKVVQPNAAIPEIDAAVPINDAVAEVTKKFDDFRKEMKDKEEKDLTERRQSELDVKWQAGKRALKSRGYTDEGIAEVEKLMEAKGLIDHEDGLIIFEKLHPPAEPAKSAGIGSYNFFEMPEKGEDMMKKLLATRGEDESTIRQLTNEAITEVRGVNRR